MLYNSLVRSVHYFFKFLWHNCCIKFIINSSSKKYLMSGRGDNNKHGTSGQGSSNQSNEGRSSHEGKSNHGKQTSGKLSEKQKKSEDMEANRNTMKE